MTELHLLMASKGGLVDPGMAIYNLLRGISCECDDVQLRECGLDCRRNLLRGHAPPSNPTLLFPDPWAHVEFPCCHGIREILGQLNTLKRNIASVLAEASKKKLEQVDWRETWMRPSRSTRTRLLRTA